MKKNDRQPITYIYNYVCDEREVDICALEIRSVFGVDFSSQYNLIESPVEFDPSRSPFINNRIDVWFEGRTVDDIIRKVQNLQLENNSFRVCFVKSRAVLKTAQPKFEERREIERKIGQNIQGKANLLKPDVVFGIMFVNGRWIFGDYHGNEALWLHHKSKPHSYSTSLNTRLARAVVNIAIPDPRKVKAIDPCCGIGTVVLEALSMGIDIQASDVNPLVMAGARENLAHFGMEGKIALKDIREVTGYFDVSIIDLPYNHCSVLSEEEKLNILKQARSFSSKTLVITIEPIDHLLKEAGFKIMDQCNAPKRTFTRQIFVCK